MKSANANIDTNVFERLKKATRNSVNRGPCVEVSKADLEYLLEKFEAISKELYAEHQSQAVADLRRSMGL
jgi:hypothetical protein